MIASQETPPATGPTALLRGARFCLLLAVAGAAYLATMSLLGGGVAGCGGGQGCNQVLGSRWAYWLGVPVGIPALGAYLLLFWLTFKAGSAGGIVAQHRAWQAIVMLSALVLGAAGWFVSLQYLVIGHWCKFCLATHLSASLAAGLLLKAAPVGEPGPLPRREFAGLSVLALVLGLVVLVAGQMAVRKRLYQITEGGSIGSGRLVLPGGKFKLDPAELPLLGSPSATNFMVSLFDYTCVHCQAMHPRLKSLLEKYPGRLAVISLPIPLDSNCNPLVRRTDPESVQACEFARLGLAVWRAGPKAYPAYDDWFFAATPVPTLEQAHAQAESLVGKDNLNRALADDWVRRQLAFDISLYRANALPENNPRLPQLMIGDIITHGAIDRLGELDDLVVQHLFMGGPAAGATNTGGR
jgi:uncharacterized membrane protein/thiol-disulfide isomerase/thioredoxin